jgi:hypothetical protein
VERLRLSGEAAPVVAIMMLLWIVSGLSLLVAIVSWVRIRRAARRLDELSQMYWELRYEVGELRVQVERLSGKAPDPPPQRPAGRVADAFVPLTTLKR